MKPGIQDYLAKGFEVKSSHVDTLGKHWIVLQKDSSVVLSKIPMSAWTGKPSNNAQDECWEIVG